MILEPKSEILRLAVAGDRTALSELIGRYRPLVRLIAARHARRVLGQTHDESDVVQMTCLEALTGFDGFRGNTEGEFAAWLEGILERTLLRLWRHSTAQKRDFRRDRAELDSKVQLAFGWARSVQVDPVEQIIAGEMAILLASALEELPSEYRGAIELRFVDGLKLREAAEKLNVSVGTVAGRLRRGIEMLHRHLPSELGELLESAPR